MLLAEMVTCVRNAKVSENGADRLRLESSAFGGGWRRDEAGDDHILHMRRDPPRSIIPLRADEDALCDVLAPRREYGDASARAEDPHVIPGPIPKEFAGLRFQPLDGGDKLRVRPLQSVRLVTVLVEASEAAERHQKQVCLHRIRLIMRTRPHQLRDEGFRVVLPVPSAVGLVCLQSGSLQVEFEGDPLRHVVHVDAWERLVRFHCGQCCGRAGDELGRTAGSGKPVRLNGSRSGRKWLTEATSMRPCAR